jgi:hypothetical protein
MDAFLSYSSLARFDATIMSFAVLPLEEERYLSG